MYAAVRDDIVLHAGYATLLDGLQDLALAGIERGVDRDLTVHALDRPQGEGRVDLASESAVSRLADCCRASGVTVCGLLMATNFGAEDLAAEIDWVVATARAAQALGAPAVRIDAIMHGERDLPLEKRQDIFFLAMARVLERTAETDVEFGIENHGYQGNDPDFLAGVLERAGDPRLGLTMDTGNFYWAGHPLDEVYAILERFAPHTKHTHVKNINYPEETRQVRRELGWEYGTYGSPIPDGDIDHTRLVGFLKAAGYDRDFTIEDESLGKFAEGDDRKNALRRDAEYVRGIL